MAAPSYGGLSPIALDRFDRSLILISVVVHCCRLEHWR